MNAASLFPIELFEGFLTRLAAQMKRTSGGLDVDELVQIGWLAAFEALPRFDPRRGTKLTTFLYGQAEGAMRGACREARRFQPEQEIVDESPNASDLLAEMQERRCLRCKLKRALRTLDPIGRRLVLRCYGRGHALREVAHSVGLEYGAARHRQERAWKQLRREMGAGR